VVSNLFDLVIAFENITSVLGPSHYLQLWRCSNSNQQHTLSFHMLWFSVFRFLTNMMSFSTSSLFLNFWLNVDKGWKSNLTDRGGYQNLGKLIERCSKIVEGPLLTHLNISFALLWKTHDLLPILLNVALEWFISFLAVQFKYSRTRLIHHHLIRLIRHFFIGPGRIPIFCGHFCSPNSSICSICHLFLSLRSVLFVSFVTCSFAFDV